MDNRRARWAQAQFRCHSQFRYDYKYGYDYAAYILYLLPIVCWIITIEAHSQLLAKVYMQLF